MGCAFAGSGAAGVAVARCGVTCAVGVVTTGVSGVGGGGPAGVDEDIGCCGAAPGAIGGNPMGRRVGQGVGCHEVGVTAGVVTQHTHLFNMTIGDNLRLARPGATQAEIEAAARTAQIHDWIVSLADGYDTLGRGAGFAPERGRASAPGYRACAPEGRPCPDTWMNRRRTWTQPPSVICLRP